MYLSYVGIRVQDLNRSLKFYEDLFGLHEVSRGDSRPMGAGLYILLRDPRSGQKLELNWYPPGSMFAPPYAPGEGLDHIAFRVESVPEALARLRGHGVEIVPIPPALENLEPGVMLAYAKDPDGNWIELYHNLHPIGAEIPPGY
jgi:catechol 2,3-dioxygenase-like lactoylglutathione lyase family enzyme